MFRALINALTSRSARNRPPGQPRFEVLEDRLCPSAATFGSAVTWPASDGPRSVAVGDFNGDGLTDLAVANYNTEGTVTVLLNTCLAAGVGLAIARGNTSVIVSWSFPSTGFVLESTTSLSLLNWQPTV